VTPDDYEPPGFYAVESSAFMFQSEPLNCKLGEVITPFHALKFNAKMEISKLENLKEVKAGSHKVKDKYFEKKTATKNTTRLQVLDSIYGNFILFLHLLILSINPTAKPDTLILQSFSF
jgi:hypothetical protein